MVCTVLHVADYGVEGHYRQARVRIVFVFVKRDKRDGDGVGCVRAIFVCFFLWLFCMFMECMIVWMVWVSVGARH